MIVDEKWQQQVGMQMMMWLTLTPYQKIHDIASCKMLKRTLITLNERTVSIGINESFLIESPSNYYSIVSELTKTLDELHLRLNEILFSNFVIFFQSSTCITKKCLLCVSHWWNSICFLTTQWLFAFMGAKVLFTKIDWKVHVIFFLFFSVLLKS